MQALTDKERRILVGIKLRNLVKDLCGIAEDDEESDGYVSERCKFAAEEIERLLHKVDELEIELREAEASIDLQRDFVEADLFRLRKENERLAGEVRKLKDELELVRRDEERFIYD